MIVRLAASRASPACDRSTAASGAPRSSAPSTWSSARDKCGVVEPVAKLGERPTERHAGADRRNHSRELAGKLARPGIGDTPDGVEHAFARGEAEGQELEHGGQLGRDSSEATLRATAEEPVTQRGAQGRCEERQRDAHDHGQGRE